MLCCCGGRGEGAGQRGQGSGRAVCRDAHAALIGANRPDVRHLAGTGGSGRERGGSRGLWAGRRGAAALVVPESRRQRQRAHGTRSPSAVSFMLLLAAGSMLDKSSANREFPTLVVTGRRAPMQCSRRMVTVSTDLHTLQLPCYVASTRERDVWQAAGRAGMLRRHIMAAQAHQRQAVGRLLRRHIMGSAHCAPPPPPIHSKPLHLTCAVLPMWAWTQTCRAFQQVGRPTSQHTTGISLDECGREREQKSDGIRVGKYAGAVQRAGELSRTRLPACEQATKRMQSQGGSKTTVKHSMGP